MPELIPVSRPDFGPSGAAAVQAVLASHWVGIGPKTATDLVITQVGHFLRHVSLATQRRKLRKLNGVIP